MTLYVVYDYSVPRHKGAPSKPVMGRRDSHFWPRSSWRAAALRPGRITASARDLPKGELCEKRLLFLHLA
jgi:hypothetical protein